MFGDVRNQPLVVRDNKLGALVNNQFCATEYDPRWAGDNWQLIVVSNDGMPSPAAPPVVTPRLTALAHDGMPSPAAPCGYAPPHRSRAP